MFQVVINASFHWPLLGNKPPPKLNSIKQLSFYLLLVLRVSVLDCGQAVGSGCWSVPCQPTVGSRIVRRLADFLSPLSCSLRAVFLSHLSSLLRTMKKILYIVEDSVFWGLRWR